MISNFCVKRICPVPIAEALQHLYAGQKRLSDAFPHRPFSLDGKLVGDIGEIIAARVFGLEHLAEGTKIHDMRAPDGRLIQVKATQKAADGRGVGLGLTKMSFQHLLVIEFDRDGTFEVLYNGPGSFIDEARQHKAGASLSRKQLRACQLRVPAELRLIELGPGVDCAANQISTGGQQINATA